MWAPKKWVFFLCGLKKKKKKGAIQCAEMQFQGKICKFYAKIATNF